MTASVRLPDAPPAYDRNNEQAMRLAVEQSLGKLVTSGASVLSGSVVDVTTTYTMGKTDMYVRADATGGAFTVTLPTAVGRRGELRILKRLNGGSNAVTVAGAGAEVIDGASTVSLSAQWMSVSLISNGAGWDVW